MKELQDADQTDHIDWHGVFGLSFKTTRETKLQSFAYKTIYRLTPCNKYLGMINIRKLTFRHHTGCPLQNDGELAYPDCKISYSEKKTFPWRRHHVSGILG